MSPKRATRGALTPLALVLVLPCSLYAQDDLLELRDRCAASNSGLSAPCLEAGLAAQAAGGAVGLTFSGGSDTPGTPSTLGRRMGASPRIAVSLRIAGTWADSPDVARDEAAMAGSESFFASGLEGRVSVGAFHGFSPLPTVGGILSLDLLGAAGFVFMPSDFGFQGNVGGVGLGARLGLLRESFSVPGVSVSVFHRWMGDVELGRVVRTGDGVQASIDPSTTSIRAVVGKDLLAMGLMLGMGWDRYGGAASVIVSPAADQPEARARVGELAADRVLYFGGLSVTYVVLQISAEAGWTGGFYELPDRGGGMYDPSEGSFFGGVSLRLTI